MIGSLYSVKPTETERLLGGYLHQDMTWNVHIQSHQYSLINQLNSRINGLKKVCKNASFETRLMVANGIVMSKLTYLITLWGGTKEYLLNALQIQQLVAARAVCGFESTRWSKRQLLRKVGWLSVRQLVFFHTVLQAHKTLITGVPKLLHHDLTLTYPRVTRCATGGQLRQGSGFVSKGTFKYRAIQNFNMVPADVKTGSTANVKTKLKKWVIANIPME